MTFHSVMPLDAYENQFRCSCGNVFTCDVGWAFCPRDTGTIRAGYAPERARTAPNGLTASIQYDHTEYGNQTAERPAEDRHMQTITRDQLAEVLEGFWFAQQVGTERTADDIWESAEALFGPDDGEPPVWTEVEPRQPLGYRNDAPQGLHADPNVYFAVINDGKIASGCRLGPFGTWEDAFNSPKPSWFMSFAGDLYGWHVSAVRIS